jgi:hypothetical protein
MLHMYIVMAPSAESVISSLVLPVTSASAPIAPVTTSARCGVRRCGCSDASAAGT